MMAQLRIDMRLIIFVLLFVAGTAGHGQKYTAESSKITFFSKSPIEDITADNLKSVSLFNAESGEIAFSVPVREFKFAKSLMEEHFNEKYLDTEKYPKSTFSGKIVGYKPATSGSQQVNAQGKFTLHGITKEIDVPGTLEEVNGKIVMKAKFMVKLEDYEIPRPQVLWQNIAEVIEVSVDFTYKPHEK